jgi:hypothetical protein
MLVPRGDHLEGAVVILLQGTFKELNDAPDSFQHGPFSSQLHGCRSSPVGQTVDSVHSRNKLGLIIPS